MLFGIRAHGPVPLPPSNFVISADVVNWNLADELGFTPTTPISVIITVNTGVVVRSNTFGTPAMDLSSVLPAGSEVHIVNDGVIHGRGGRGGHAGFPAGAGQAGSDAIKGPGTGVTFDIDNGSGRIFGGGGGGGAGGRSTESVETSPGEFEVYTAGGGGGGGGAGGGSSGNGMASIGPGKVDGQSGGAGTNGSSGVPGTGGAKGTVPAVCDGGNGASGGDYGQPGTAGSAATGGTNNGAGAAAGAAGKAIELNGGSVTFLSGNTASRVKGAVS